MELIDRLHGIEQDALANLASLDSLPSLEQWRLEVLGRKGLVADAMKGLGTLAASDRPRVGERANEIGRAHV